MTEKKTATPAKSEETPDIEKIQEELKLVKEENEILKQAGNHDLSWYGKEIDRITRENEELKAVVKSNEARKHEQEREAAVLLEDAKNKEERERAQYVQTAETRFRALTRPTIRDIYGDTAYPVFDLSVELMDYRGPVQIPVHVVIEMGQSIGMLTKEQAEEVKQELAFSKAKNEKAALLGTELTGGISALVQQFYIDLDNIADTSADEGKADSAELGKSDSDSGKSDETNGQANGANSGEKSNGVSSDTSNADDADGIRKSLGL